ncbi:hypothetical protein BCV70DRAFT_66658 [Testicularia cyperi]|uniref:Uncharacterized protein n=1 Tax=Testicularia cyperi TaxID=1882483 RepID=A0A317XHZ4_9BASI|nr:hypothetical protein BCV70DRAFT_66658 [Testicularia cyperi]
MRTVYARPEPKYQQSTSLSGGCKRMNSFFAHVFSSSVSKKASFLSEHEVRNGRADRVETCSSDVELRSAAMRACGPCGGRAWASLLADRRSLIVLLAASSSLWLAVVNLLVQSWLHGQLTSAPRLECTEYEDLRVAA